MEGLRSSPAATFICVVGLGVAGALFAVTCSVSEAVLFKTLPLSRPSDVHVVEGIGFLVKDGFPRLPDVLSRSASVESSAFYSVGLVNLSLGDCVGRMHAAQVSGDFFRVVGASAVRGRLIGDSDIGMTRASIAVISQDLWERCGVSEGASGNATLVGGRPFDIVGVAAKRFKYPVDADIWLPVALNDKLFTGAIRFDFLALLRPGWSPAAVENELRQQGETTWRTDGGRIHLVQLRDHLLAPIRPLVMWLQVAASIAYGVGFLNALHIQVGTDARLRRREAVAALMGAPAWRLRLERAFRYCLVGTAACILAIFIAFPLTTQVAARLPVGFRWVADAGLGARTIVFVTLLTLAMMALAATLSGSRSGDREVAATLSGRSRWSSADRRTRRLSRILVALELAAASGLAVAMVLLMMSFQRLTRVDPGLRPERVLVAGIPLAGPDYADHGVRARWFKNATEQVRLMPGVVTASVTNNVPYSGRPDMKVTLKTSISPASSEPTIDGASYRIVGPEYCRVLGIPILDGREFRAEDLGHAERAVLVNDRVAAALWPGARAIGQQMFVDDGSDGAYEVVGVIGNVRHRFLTAPPDPELYFLYSPEFTPSDMAMVIKSSLDPRELQAPVRRVLGYLAPAVPVDRLGDLPGMIADSYRPQRLVALTVTAFAWITLGIAAMGVFALASQGVLDRRSELAIRLAVGATPRDNQSMLLVEAIRDGAAAIAVGVFAGWFLARFITSIIPSLTVPREDLAAAAATAVVMHIVLLASVLGASSPARHTDLSQLLKV